MLFITVNDKGMIIPGEHGEVRLTLLKSMVMNAGQTFTIRDGKITVATGIITKSHGSVELPSNKLSMVQMKK